jgi:hypothetical protein
MIPSRLRFIITFALLLASSASWAQGLPAAYAERFDSTGIPLLPAGWSTSSARDPEGDFFTTASGAASSPGCAISSNATVRQYLQAPPAGLTGWSGCAVSWNERRSASHDASISLALSVDGGATFVAVTVPPLPPPGGTQYARRSTPLPGWTDGLPGVILRWTAEGDGTGATGTLRIDDVLVTGRPAHDLSIELDTTSPRRPLPGTEVRCAGRVVNTGTAGVEDALVSWAIDEDGNGAPSPEEYGGVIHGGSVPPGSGAGFEFQFVRTRPGDLRVFAIVDDPGGAVSDNDTASLLLPPAAAPGSVVITEIMYDPLAGLPEYVELLNRSGAPVDLGGWRLVDDEEDSTGGRLGPPGGTDSGTGGPVLPDAGYLVASPDSALNGYPVIPPGTAVAVGLKGLSLNNGGDLLLLLDEGGGVIDRVAYLPSWHTPALEETQGRSLERIDPASPGSEGWNWGTSAGSNGGTPGGPNSLSVPVAGRSGGLECVPNPFSPDGDGFEDVTSIAVRPGSGASIARARIYDIQGRLVRTLTAGGYLGPEGSFAWNGYDDRGRKAPIGIYVVVVDTVEGGGGGAASWRAAVVVAGKL